MEQSVYWWCFTIVMRIVAKFTRQLSRIGDMHLLSPGKVPQGTSIKPKLLVYIWLNRINFKVFADMCPLERWALPEKSNIVKDSYATSRNVSLSSSIFSVFRYETSQELYLSSKSYIQVEIISTIIHHLSNETCHLVLLCFQQRLIVASVSIVVGLLLLIISRFLSKDHDSDMDKSEHNTLLVIFPHSRSSFPSQNSVVVTLPTDEVTNTLQFHGDSEVESLSLIDFLEKPTRLSLFNIGNVGKDPVILPNCYLIQSSSAALNGCENEKIKKCKQVNMEQMGSVEEILKQDESHPIKSMLLQQIEVPGSTSDGSNNDASIEDEISFNTISENENNDSSYLSNFLSLYDSTTTAKIETVLGRNSMEIAIATPNDSIVHDNVALCVSRNLTSTPCLLLPSSSENSGSKETKINVNGKILKSKYLPLKNKESFFNPVENYTLNGDLEMLLASDSRVSSSRIFDIGESFDWDVLKLKEILDLFDQDKAELKRVRKDIEMLDTIDDKEKVLQQVRFFLYMSFEDEHFNEVSNHCMKWVPDHIDQIIRIIGEEKESTSIQGILVLRDYLTFASKYQVSVSHFNYCFLKLIEVMVIDPQFKEVITKSICTIVVALDSTMLESTLFTIIENQFQSPIQQTPKQVILLRCMKYYICFNKDSIVEELVQESYVNKSKTCAFRMLRLLNTSLETKMESPMKSKIPTIRRHLKQLPCSSLNTSFKLELIDLYLIFVDVLLNGNRISPSVQYELLTEHISKFYELVKPLVESEFKKLPPPELKELHTFRYEGPSPVAISRDQT